MGLMSFVKEAGRKVGLFGGRAAADADAAKTAAALAAESARREADAAKKGDAERSAVAADIRAAILSYVAVDGLDVSFNGFTATVKGKANVQADKEKALLVAGNTEGVGQVDDQLEVLNPEPPAVYRTVVKGDTLSAIAAEQYGVMRLYDVIFEANKPMLEHPDRIYPGQVLRIPPVKPPVHVVAKGETLGAIAKHWYGDPKRYTAIFEANKGTLANPDAISVGQSLTIPLVDPKVAPLA